MNGVDVRLPGNALELNASQHLGRAPGGGSGAQLYKVAEDDQIYVVKLKGTAQGIRVLFNEYVSGRIGEMIGVPFGDHALITVPDALLPPPGEPNIISREPGKQFGTIYYENAQSDLLQLRAALNYSKFPSVVVFDTFILRGNGRQYLVYPSVEEQNAPRDTGGIFDQGYAFTGQPSWTAASLGAQGDCVANNGLSLKNDFNDFAAYEPYVELLEGMTTTQLTDIVSEAPLLEWLVTQEEADTLTAWLSARKSLVRRAIEDYLR